MDRNQSVKLPEFQSLSSWLSTPAVLTSAIAISILLMVVTLRQKGRRVRLLPGPTPWPIIGNLGIFGEKPYLDCIKLAKKYGPIFRLRMGSKETVIVSSPAMAEEILKTHDVKFASRPQNAQYQIMGFNNQTVVVAPYGSYWRYARKIFTLEMMTTKRLQEFEKARREEVLKGLYELLEESKDRKPACLRDIICNTMMNIFTRMLMNKTFYGPSPTEVDKAEVDLVRSTMKKQFELAAVFNIGDCIPFLKPFDLQGYEKRMWAIKRKSDRFYNKILADHRQRLQQEGSDAKVTDLVDVLITRHTQKGEKALTDDQIKGMLQDVLFAGIDSTSNTMEWILTELLIHPDMLKKAQDEVEAVVGRDRLVEEADIPKLKYISVIIKETMRLHTPAPMLLPHASTEDCEVAGYFIPAKAQVFINLYGITRDPEVWDRPSEFLPERWDNTKIDFNGHDFEYFPFGAGRRLCPGKNMALSSLGFMTALFLQACDWELPDGMKPEDMDMESDPGQASPKKIPLVAVAYQRLPVDVIDAGKRESNLL